MREGPGTEGVSKCPESHNELDLAEIQHGTNWKPVGQFLVSIATGGPKNSFAHFSGENAFCLQYLMFRQRMFLPQRGGLQLIGVSILVQRHEGMMCKG